MIDWTKAPDWAQYHAFDGEGDGTWFEFKPRAQHFAEAWSPGCGRLRDSDQVMRHSAKNWAVTLTVRPKT